MAGFDNTPPGSEFRKSTSWGRTRGVKNATGTHGSSLTTTTASPADLTDGTLGYATENQRFMHLAINTFPGVVDNNAVFFIWGYSYAFGRWALLTRHDSGFENLWYTNDDFQNRLHHGQNTNQCTRYVFEIAGIDRIYLSHGGTFLAGTDKVYLGFNTF